MNKQSILEKNLSGRRTKTVQKTISGIRESFYGINISFLGEGFQTNPEVVEAGGGGDEVTVVATELTGFEVDPENETVGLGGSLPLGSADGA